MPGKPKGVVIILDGLGDRPSPLLGGATPLEAAATPNLDRIAADGQCGQVDPFVPGMPVGTHTGTSLLMGVAPKDAFQLSRGPIEASGVGIPVQPGDVALRCNFATLERESDRMRIVDRRAGRIRKGTDELAAALNNINLGRDITASIYPASQHRAVLRLSGPNLSQSISDTDPGEVTRLCYVLSSVAQDAGDTAATNTADAVNTFVEKAFEILSDHPVNQSRIKDGLIPATGIITRGAGFLQKIHSLLNHLDMKVAVVAGERTLLGLAKWFQYTAITDATFSALPDTDLDAKVESVLKALETHDLVYLHIKGTDTCSHDRDPQRKANLIERIDIAVAPLLKPELVVGLSADHSTDSTLGRHCGDPVPSIVYAVNGRKDACRSFGETESTRGGLGRISAHAFLLTILDAMDRLHEYRTSDAPFLAQN